MLHMYEDALMSIGSSLDFKKIFIWSVPILWHWITVCVCVRVCSTYSYAIMQYFGFVSIIPPMLCNSCSINTIYS